MSNKLITFVLFMLILAIGVQAAQQTVNLTIMNTTVTLNGGTANATYSINETNSSSHIFAFNVTDCVSTSANVTLNVTTVGVDYALIKSNTVCNLNQSCPQPSCPEPSCPATTCPSLDYAPLLSAITTSSDATMQKLVEVNSSLSRQRSGSFGFPELPSWAPFAAIIALIGAFATKDRWLPKVKQFSKQQKEKIVKNEGEEEPE
ncbi:MAG: hypothetical protein HY376_03115 [Candidatus Blackburnbacteria bacterium]|nr:hypothetical protein [Candidatus Blackburnbacteria bacterium]